MSKFGGKKPKGADLIRYAVTLDFEVEADDIGTMVLPAPLRPWREAVFEAVNDKGRAEGRRFPMLAVFLSLWSFKTDDPNEMELCLDEVPATLRELKVVGKKGLARVSYVLWVDGSEQLATPLVSALGYPVVVQTKQSQGLLPFTPRMVELDEEERAEELPPEADEEEEPVPRLARVPEVPVASEPVPRNDGQTPEESLAPRPKKRKAKKLEDETTQEAAK